MLYSSAEHAKKSVQGEEQLPEIFIHRQSAYLIGRERKIADLPVDHPSCSKQHAV